MIRFVAGWLAFGAANLALVITVFGPVADLPVPAGPPVHPAIAFAVYITLAVGLFAWTAARIGNPWHAAAILGGSQFILVNVDMVLRGDRAIETALASTVMMIVTWGALALVWRFAPTRKAGT